MGAYKQFNSQDIIISPFEVNKGFSYEGSVLEDSNVGINRFLGRKGNFLTNKTLTGKIPGQDEYEVLVYDSVKQLYYTNYISGSSNGHMSNATTASFNSDGTITGPAYQTNFDNYEQNTSFTKKNFPTGSNSPVGVVSIPSKLYGDYIQPNSFIIKSANSGSVIDDGHGRLYMDPTDPNFSGDSNVTYYVGNIIYQHGLSVITNDETPSTPPNTLNFIESFVVSTDVTCSFSSSYEIFETQYKVTINPDEFNYSPNPTLLSGNQGDLYPHFTGSYFDPYVTTIGLYNRDFELLAVGKLAKTLPTSRTTDTSILINIDR